MPHGVHERRALLDGADRLGMQVRRCGARHGTQPVRHCGGGGMRARQTVEQRGVAGERNAHGSGRADVPEGGEPVQHARDARVERRRRLELAERDARQVEHRLALQVVQIVCCAAMSGASNQASRSASSFGLTHQPGQAAGSLPLPRMA